MTIKKRKPRLRLHKHRPEGAHAAMCRELCNRLQAGEGIDAARKLASLPQTLTDEEAALKLIERLSAEITVLQMNYPDQVSFRVQLSYEDREAAPLHGYLYPKHCACVVAPTFVLAVFSAYIQLSKQAEIFI